MKHIKSSREKYYFNYSQNDTLTNSYAKAIPYRQILYATLDHCPFENTL